MTFEPEIASNPAEARRLAVVWGAALFLLAFGFRLFGIGWGLPFEGRHWSLHPDEPVVFAMSRRVEPAKLDFTPGFYNYGTLGLTVSRILSDLVAAYGGGPRAEDGSDQWRWVGRTHLAARALSAAAGGGLAWVLFALLRRRTNLLGATFGSLAVAFAPGLVVHSRFHTVDVFATFLLALSLFYALELVPHDDRPAPLPADRTALLCGIFAGLSAGTKYAGFLALVALAAVAVSTRRWRTLAVGSTAAIAAFTAVTPGIVLDGDRFWRDFLYEIAHTSTGHGLVFAGTAPGFVYHVGNLILGYGLLLTGLSVVGLGLALQRRLGWVVPLLAFGVAYYALVGRAEVKFLRYVFPLLPVLAAGFGWWAGWVHSRGDRMGRAFVVVAILALGGVIGGGASLSAQATEAMSGPDPRDVAGRWLRRNGEGKTVGLVSDPWFTSPTLYPEVSAPRWVPFVERDARMRAVGRPRVMRYVPEDPEARYDWDVRLLDLRPDFVAYSSFETEGLERLAANPASAGPYRLQLERYVEFSRRLQQEYELAQVFPPETAFGRSPLTQVHDLMYVRPIVWVWKRKTLSETPSRSTSTTSGSSAGRAGTR